MKYIDLVNELSTEDKIKIQNFISAYAVNKAEFIGVDEWLQNWSHSNQKLYRLLGNKLIHEFEYQYEKPQMELKNEVMNDLFCLEFKQSYHEFYHKVIVPLNKEDKLDTDTRRAFSALTDSMNFVEDKVYQGFKYRKEGAKSTLQIQSGMKPMKALAKVVEYFKDDFAFNGFEQFRLKHSQILNDRFLKGDMCISIHPLDFMTMSDNSYGWHSCMSWVEDGCYHVGTVEMMNSNNVVCCYLRGKNNYNFYPSFFNEEKMMHTYGKLEFEDKYNDSHWTWRGNKKWRILGYVTKDIIMSGKAYPYVNEDFAKRLIEEIKNLANANMGWTYSFGPELYQDMVHINSSARMDNNRNWIKWGGAKKHNILWDTKGMYNDMLNDRSTNYWCYRNKVKSNKILSVSGKATCLCCGESVVQLTDDSYYNDRYSGVGNTVCEDCRESKFECQLCGHMRMRQELLQVTKPDGTSIKICSHCFKEHAKLCPDCGRPMWVSYQMPERLAFAYAIKGKNEKELYLSFDKERDLIITKYAVNFADPLFCCSECAEKHRDELELRPFDQRWGRNKNYAYIFKDGEQESKYFFDSLKDADPEIREFELESAWVSATETAEEGKKRYIQDKTLEQKKTEKAMLAEDYNKLEKELSAEEDTEYPVGSAVVEVNRLLSRNCSPWVLSI